VTPKCSSGKWIFQHPWEVTFLVRRELGDFEGKTICFRSLRHSLAWTTRNGHRLSLTSLVVSSFPTLSLSRIYFLVLPSLPPLPLPWYSLAEIGGRFGGTVKVAAFEADWVGRFLRNRNLFQPLALGDIRSLLLMVAQLALHLLYSP
jgi:hypothetical protein